MGETSNPITKWQSKLHNMARPFVFLRLKLVGFWRAATPSFGNFTGAWGGYLSRPDIPDEFLVPADLDRGREYLGQHRSVWATIFTTGLGGKFPWAAVDEPEVDPLCLCRGHRKHFQGYGVGASMAQWPGLRTTIYFSETTRRWAFGKEITLQFPKFHVP